MSGPRIGVLGATGPSASGALSALNGTGKNWTTRAAPRTPPLAGPSARFVRADTWVQDDRRRTAVVPTTGAAAGLGRSAARPGVEARRLRRDIGLYLLIIVALSSLWLCTAPRALLALPADWVELPALAPITAVPDAAHVVVARGARDGLLGCALAPVYPLRLDDKKQGSYDDQNILAWGSCAPRPSGDDGKATRLAVQGAAVKLAVGDVVGWRWAAPAGLAREPLVQLLALGLEPLRAEDRTPLATLAELQARPQPAEVERLIAKLVRESNQGGNLAREFYPTSRVTGGRHGGALLAEALERTTAVDVLEFLDYAATYRDVYAGRRFLWLDIFATWLTNGAPNGAKQRRRDQAQQLRAQVEAALRQGLAEKSATLLQDLKVLDVNDRFAAPTARKLARLANLRSRIDDDPTDQDLQAQLAVLLSDLGMLEAAFAAWQRLLELKPGHGNALAQQAQLAERMDHWPQALALWQAVQSKRGGYERSISRAQKVIRAAELPADATAACDAGQELAAMSAHRPVGLLTEMLRRCRRLTVRPVQLRQAWELEQKEVGLLGREAAQRYAAAEIADHNYLVARRRLDDLTSRCEGDKPAMVQALNDLIDVAMASGALRMAEELVQRWRALSPDDNYARVFLGILRMTQRRPAEALEFIDAALDKDAGEGFGYWMRVRLLNTLGRTAQARAAAERLLQVDSRSLMALVSAARVAVAEGRYQDGVQKMGKAWARAFTQAGSGGSELGERAAVEMAAECAANLRLRPADHGSALRMVRALLELDLVPQAEAQWLLLPKGSPAWREAAALLGGNTSVPAERVVPWLRAGQDGSLLRRQTLAAAEAEALVSRAPNDAKALLQLALAQVPRGQFGEALDAVAWARGQVGVDAAALAALDQAEAAAARGLKANSEMQQSTAAGDQSDHTQAAAASRAALADYLAIGALEDAARAAGRLASDCAQAGDDACALRAAQQAVAVAEQLGDRDDVVIRSEVLAQIKVRQGDLAAWAPALEAVERMTREHGLIGHLAEVTLHRTWLARQEGRWAAALELARRARQLAERGGRPKTHRRAMLEEAYALRDAAQLPEAATVAAELLRASRDADDGDRQRAALKLLINLAWQQGDADLTQRWMATAQEVARRADRSGFGAELQYERAQWLLLGQGNAKGALAELQGLAEQFRKIGDHTSQVEAEVLQARALLEADLPDQATAAAARAEHKAQARALVVPAAQAALLLALASRPGAAEALPAARRALAAARKLELPEFLALALHAEAVALQRAGQPALAAERFAQAVDALVAQAVSSTERQVGKGTRRELDRVWADAIAAELAAGRADKAQHYSSLARAVQARQGRALAAVALGSDDPTVRAFEQAQQQRRAALHSARGVKSSQEQAAWRGRAADAAKTAAQLLEKMRREHRKLWTQVAVEPEALAAALPHLPKNTLIVQYFATATDLHMFVVGGRDPATRVVTVHVPWAQVEAAVASWRRAVTGTAERVAVRGAEAMGLDLPEAPTPTAGQSERTASEALYGWLLAPLQAELRQANQVLVVPFGALHYLPLHALARWDSAGQPRYAIEEFRIGYLSATTATALGSRARAPGNRLQVLGLGNPDGTLPGARVELERVAGLLPAGSRLFFGAEATGKRFLSLAPGFDVLHIATHGVLRTDPADSHLKMADGPLTLATISGASGLDRRPRLVVLSACSTALEAGKPPGDEIASLSTAFAIAGVPTLLASLWDVEDEATAELMAQFYTALLRANAVDTLEALRGAQLHVLQLGRKGRPGWQSPAAWAAMQLVGDPR